MIFVLCTNISPDKRQGFCKAWQFFYNSVIEPSGIRKCFQNLKLKRKTLWPLFVDGVQLSQGYRANTKRQFTYYH